MWAKLSLHSFKNSPTQPPDLRLVKEALLVIDVIGGDFKYVVKQQHEVAKLMFRNHIVERYIQLQLAEYRRIFRSTDEAGQLDNVPRRYAWFRRILKHHDEEDAALFPASWEVTRLLVANFSEYTRGDLANVLGKGTPNVNTLLEALQSTLDFEAGFAKRFERPVSFFLPVRVVITCNSSRRSQSAVLLRQTQP